MENPPSADFLTDEDIEELAALTIFPDEFPGVADGADVDYPSRFKYPYASAGSTHAICPEDLVEIHGAVLAQISDPIIVTQSGAVPWAPRGEGIVPIFANQAQVVLRIQVPQGYVFWIDGYAFDLFPNTSNELNYIWQLRINGLDFLNKGNPVPQPGRPVHSPQKVTIGRTKAEMFVTQPGSVIEVVVQAINTLGASDSVSATVFGQLEGRM